MEIDAIGGAVNAATSEATNTIDLEGFLRLFITQLTYQDPTNPTSNEEFLAQMAQFAGLEQQRQTAERVEGLLTMNSADQSVNLLGKRVQVDSEQGSGVGTVSSIRFTDQGPALNITVSSNRIIPNVRLSQIQLIRN